MTTKPTTTRKWSAIIAILAVCFAVGYGIGYLVGKFM